MSFDEMPSREAIEGSESTEPALEAITFLRLDPKTEVAALGVGADTEIQVVDWFGEGTRDLLVSASVSVGRRATHLYRWMGEPDGAHYAPQGHLSELEGLRCLGVIARAEGKGFDLVALGDEGLLWLPANAEGPDRRFPQRVPLGITADLGLNPLGVRRIRCEDWDGDGRTDLLIEAEDHEGYWPKRLELLPLAQRLGFDVDGAYLGYDRHGNWAGRLPHTRFFWMRQEEPASDGTPRFAPPEPLELGPGEAGVPGPNAALLPLSWKGRGSWECVVVDPDGSARLYRNFGGQRPPVLMDSTPLTTGAERLYLPEDRAALTAADLDGDRRAELLVARADGRIVRIAPSGSKEATTREAGTLNTVTTRLWVGAGAVASAGDLDADGDLDLVVGDASGRLWLIEDKGDAAAGHTYAPPVEIDTLGEPYRLRPVHSGQPGGPASASLGHARPTIADWKANGRPDLIVSGVDGRVRFFRNNGSTRDPRFDRPEPLMIQGEPLIMSPRVQPAVCLWSPDSEQPDLIGLDLQGFLCVYPRLDVMELDEPIPLTDPTGRMIRLDGAFGRAGGCSLWAGPWTTPDSMDILVCLAPGAEGLVPLLTGQPDTPPPGPLSRVLLLRRLGEDVVTPHALGMTPQDGFEWDKLELLSICGINWRGRPELDLMATTSSGFVVVMPREILRW